MTISEFQRMVPPGRLKNLSGSLWGECVSHQNLRCTVGFYFERFAKLSDELLLYKMQFSPSQPGLKIAESFELFQQHFEATYGPAESAGSQHGFPSYRWVLRNEDGSLFGEVRHCVQERFGLEEHLYISI